ncbi:hypothetical protein EDB92DRAFT_1820108 [Lactarius akahatsu]|uniref:Uncharacterized protein n=1 Tax=Lactarius akahatsu TaxID=416441 RepID=A0AAD4L627_9AGAM|nr:hypothetical protein EDB92DRAFT_1820108 [Lactarius akahatsu]
MSSSRFTFFLALALAVFYLLSSHTCNYTIPCCKYFPMRIEHAKQKIYAHRPKYDQSILSVVKASKGQNVVEVAVPTADTDINAVYEDAIHVLSTKLPKEKEEDATTMQEDYDRNFRTNVLLTWVLSNKWLTC